MTCTCGYGGQHEPTNPLCEAYGKEMVLVDADLLRRMAARLTAVSSWQHALSESEWAQIEEWSR
jgi:hypothetical protein